MIPFCLAYSFGQIQIFIFFHIVSIWAAKTGLFALQHVWTKFVHSSFFGLCILSGADTTWLSLVPIWWVSFSGQLAFFSVFLNFCRLDGKSVSLEIKFRFCHETSFCFSPSEASFCFAASKFQRLKWKLYQLLHQLCQQLFLFPLFTCHFSPSP